MLSILNDLKGLNTSLFYADKYVDKRSQFQLTIHFHAIGLPVFLALHFSLHDVLKKVCINEFKVQPPEQKQGHLHSRNCFCFFLAYRKKCISLKPGSGGATRPQNVVTTQITKLSLLCSAMIVTNSKISLQ